MRHLFIFLVLLLAACGNNQTNNGDGANSSANADNAGTDVCDDFLAEDDGAGEFCDVSEDCPSVDCPCDDGSTVGTTSCSNGVCEGRDACESACANFDAAYTCGDDNASANNGANNSANTSTNGDANASTNGDANSDTNSNANASTNGNTNSDNNSAGSIPTGDPCPQFGCTPPFRPAATDCTECEGGKCYVSDSEAYCTIECNEAADCPASFDGNLQRRCVANVCVKG